MKMQDVKFRDMDELLEFLPEDQRIMLELLRELVQECIPRVREKLRYNAPFYTLNKTICYIWPGAVPWGKATFSGVQFGFTKGYLLRDDHQLLESGKRKYVRTVKFNRPEEIDIDMMRMFLFEAAELDQ